MKEWWNNATILAFKKQTQCIIDQYSSYRIEEIGLNLNGFITQGENIADNGGLKQSFRVRFRYRLVYCSTICQFLISTCFINSLFRPIRNT